ncbi:MAG: M28 family peptidase [Ignavibacteria bacterium]|nr:M28 family peptidase [Ignavibacteria bacterium]
MKRIAQLFFLLQCTFSFAFTQTLRDEIKDYVKYLSSDELEGRRAGEKGNNTAAEYLVQHFKKWNLEPIGDNGTYLQRFEFVSGVKTDASTMCFATIPPMKFDYVLDSTFRPLGFSADTSISAELVFAGYGISAPKLNYDDYANIDVAGKIVLVLRYNPPTDSTNEKEFQRLSALYKKASVAKEKGAKGIIFVTGAVDEENPKLMRLRHSNDEGTIALAAISMKWTSMDTFFRLQNKTIRDVQKEINTTKQPASFSFGNVTMNITIKLNRVKASSQNVVGVIRGNNAQLNEEYIVVGAHYDHLGFGGEGSGSTKPDTIAVHNGADDNASGTAGMLTLARLFSENRNTLQRSLIFIGFSAEELGLLGSAYYTNHPLIPLDKTVMMLNMDMIGRLKNKELIVYGTGTSPLFDSLLNAWNTDSMFTLKKTKDGFGPSDQTSFYVKDIPVLFFFTNLHDDYHNYNDDWNKINYEGEEQVVQYAYNITNALQAMNEKPKFTRVTSSEQQSMSGDRRGAKASLGVVPAFGEEVRGAKLSGVRPGSAAEKAGLQKDDVIVKFAGKEVNNLMDLTNYLGDFKPGDAVEIVVLRGNENVTLKAILTARQQ